MLVMLTTCPDRKSAFRIAESLVKAKLAACVNTIKIEKSFYIWEGKLQKESEYLLVIKTSDKVYSRLEKHLKKIHPYSVPEILAFKVQKGSENYVNWINQSVH